MQPKLIIADGPAAGTEWTLEVGKNVTIGRVDDATIVLRDDPMLSNVHFALEWDGAVCRVRDLKSKFGITVNKVPVDSAFVRDGDRIKAGQTEFELRLPTGPSATGSEAMATPKIEAVSGAATADVGMAGASADAKSLAVLEFLRAQPAPLFALLDGARDIRIYVMLMACKEQFQSLYEGPQGEALAPQGPYLVSLPKESPFLETLVREGWGKSWGVYLTSPSSFAEVRKHFRRFLEVRLPTGKVAYFRYYDPRVLRTYLPTCTSEEREQFFGPVQRFICEGKGADMMLRFRRGGVADKVAVSVACPQEGVA
ncbi:MAG: DUF4123 domain-containing protein [Planctomycetes bacterium]|nr:DUF4123 domain-containing protein [Planctomycetota bacterium]